MELYKGVKGMAIERTPIQQISLGSIGKGAPGWWFERAKDGLKVMFQCPYGHKMSLAALKVNSRGDLSSMIECYCGKYQVNKARLASWPSELTKPSGSLAIKRESA